MHSDARRPTAVAIWLQVLAIVLLSLLGLALGVITGIAAMGPILGMLLPIAGATVFLHREGSGWRELGFFQPMAPRRVAGYTLAALIGAYLVTTFLVTPLMEAAGARPLNVAGLKRLIEGNLGSYLVFLLPVGWGSAAFGEELIARGFLQNRFRLLFGAPPAVVVQAAIFASAHFYQGAMGVVNIFALAIVFGAVYERCGRNLWPVILAHGIVDTIGITLIYLGHADLLTGA